MVSRAGNPRATQILEAEGVMPSAHEDSFPSKLRDFSNSSRRDLPVPAADLPWPEKENEIGQVDKVSSNVHWDQE